MTLPVLSQVSDSILPHLSQGSWQAIAIAAAGYAIKQGIVYFSRNAASATTEAARIAAAAAIAVAPCTDVEGLAKQAITNEIAKQMPALSPGAEFTDTFGTEQPEEAVAQIADFVDPTPRGPALESQ